MSSVSTIDGKRMVLVIVLLAAFGLLAYGVLWLPSWLAVHVSWMSQSFIRVVLLLIGFLVIAAVLYRRVAPFLGAYTQDELRPLLEARVSTGNGKTPLKEIIGNEGAILYFYSEDDPDRTNKVSALQDRMEAYKDADIKVYGVSVPPVTTKSSDVRQPVQNQQFQVLVDKDKEAVSALRRLNTQLREPQVALLIAPDGRLSKMYSEATSSTQANKILEDANVLSNGGNMSDQANGDDSRAATDQTADQTKEQVEDEKKSPPYSLVFASAAIGVGLIAYIVTVLAFRTEVDSVVITGALGGLFTLIGTVAGAYFGIKLSSDTEDKANKRVQEANEDARNAAGALDPNTWKNLKRQRQV